MNRNAVLVVLLFFFGMGVVAQDAQWRGPERNGIYSDSSLLKVWPEDGPELLLRVDSLGGGYATPVMYEGLIYITGRVDSIEYLSAVTMEGEILWKVPVGKAWMANFQETRNTPTIRDGRVYIASTMGTVNCIDSQSGEVIWKVEVDELYGGIPSRFGSAESLLLLDSIVLSSPVGEQTSIVALDIVDGSVVWESEALDATRAYASPTLIEYNGHQVILAQSSKHFFGVDPSDGEMLFSIDLTIDYAVRGRRNHTNSALYKDGEIFVSMGYDCPAIMFSLAEDCKSISIKWTSDVLDNHHHGLVEIDGFIYGSNWLSNGKGNWVCLNWDTGEVMYEEEWHNKGSMIYADGLLYVLEEKRGNLGLVEATPEGFKVVSSFMIDQGRGPRWAHPSIYDGKLLVRHGEVLLVYGVANSQ